MEDQQRELFFSSRDRHPPDPAINFIEKGLTIPGETAAVFSERASSFVALDEAKRQREESIAMWRGVSDDLDGLFDLMQKAQERLHDKKKKGSHNEGVPNLRKCNWGNVMDEVRSTAYRWKNKPDKQGKTMVFIDKIGRNSESLESWLGLLPMGDYGSSICGVFKLAVGAAGQYGKVEEVIFEALSEIPIVMEGAQRYVKMYGKMKDQFLEKRTFELFRSIVKLLRHIMQFFADSKPQKLIESILKQGAYKDELIKSVEDVHSRAQAVRHEAQYCDGQVLRGVDERIRSVDERSQHMQVLFQRMLNLLYTHPFYGSQYKDLAHTQDERSRHEVSSYDLANVDYTVPSDDDGETNQGKTYLKGLLLDFDKSEDIRTAANRKEAEADRSRLFKCLSYDPNALPREIASELRLGYQLDSKAKSRAAAVIRHREFRHFMEEVHSSTFLLINGREDISSSDGVSPLSIVVAQLGHISRSLAAESAPLCIVQYFCAAHKSLPVLGPNAPRTSSVSSMMASLIGQLASQLVDKGVNTDLSFMKDSTWRKLQRLEPKFLCQLFGKLVYQMPAGGVVLCIIDEISLYETRFLGDQTNLVMEKLVRLAKRQRDPGQVFKLLVTCQDRSVGVHRYFLGHTLDLPEEVDEDDSADWTIDNMAP